MVPKASMTDGYLDVLVFQNKDVFNMLKYALAAPLKAYSRFKDVKYIKAKEISIKSKKPVLAHVDCELIGTTPLKVEVCPKILNIICK